MINLFSTLVEFSAPSFPLDELADQIAAPGYAHFPNIMPASAIVELIDILEEKEAADALHLAGVGQGAALDRKPEIRSDSIFWLEDVDPSPAVIHWLSAMRQIREHLRRSLFLPLESYEGHLARYPVGGFYKPHLDQHQACPTRQITIIAYLNTDWQPGDGGELRLYTSPEQGIQGPHIDFAPTAGTIIAFRSADFWHEVLPAKVPRLSLTGWLRGREIDPTKV
ncbi:2OG-Fe(II) oxygenase [Oceaniferula spumae]|uniref:2OG-Fe(II) oxygenase n=1 Tax=Oceaniferula spumae TaxID=2979115 RepID=A0AAT9FHU0_9BACT